MLKKMALGIKYLRVITMVNDFVCTSAMMAHICSDLFLPEHIHFAITEL